MRNPRVRVSLTAWSVAASLLVAGGAATTGRAQAPSPDAPAIYKSKCLMCHGVNGATKVPATNLADATWAHGSSQAEVSAVIRNGVKGTLMQSFRAKLTDPEIEALAKYVRSFDKTLK
jgi:mono/diheme cytochrome c family protein